MLKEREKDFFTQRFRRQSDVMMTSSRTVPRVKLGQR
ncbi:Uncharacterised protein [Yersinia nurmii]|uniref:Uncharacterized protein n=1 Tax=Yersinia nurmii TaxID=685706 RepID=A0ABM9S4C7_9GAMM|nr:Uncharacterised protein [Yersinia nurmii]